MDNCTKKYGDEIILTHISLSLSQGMYFVKGNNGSGKSVLLRSVATVEQFSSGNFENKAKNILYLTDQSLTHNYLTIEENISLLYSIHRLSLSNKEKDFIESLFTDTQVSTLTEKASLGMKLKVGCALLAKRNYWDLIVLDETLSSIDHFSRNLILEICEKLVQDKACILIVSHNDIDKEYQHSSKILRLKEGRLVSDG